jgi:UDP-2-acetamido-3-amino-2,3-dideoxy-glucuronate N-acetyltransferase
MGSQYPQVARTESYQEILDNPAIRGIVIASPAATHYELAAKGIKAGKDVLVEKPLALNSRDGETLVELAAKHNRILMVGHILLYHPAVIKLKELIHNGDLGRIHYVQSNRLSMGKVRSEENILWSFAPHDISMILYLLEDFPTGVRASGYCHLQRDIEDVTISILDFSDGVGAHIYVSWMNPFKEHRLVVIGDEKMAVFEDSSPDHKLKLFHHNFRWRGRRPVPVKGPEERVDYVEAEPLRLECAHFLECIKTRSRPRSDGEEGLRTLRVLERCYESMKKGSATPRPSAIAAPATPRDYFAHETALVDEPAHIGKGTKIWHFSHVMKDAQIGENCNIGQNVVVGRGVRIGDGCKIQNNVSIYEGVTLEDFVFCGPSMVFTNVYNPRCEIPRMKELRPTLVKRGVTIGANATLICGSTIGQYAFIGAGAVVTDSVEDYALMVGNPARRIGWMCRCGNRLQGEDAPGAVLSCTACSERYERLASGGIARLNEQAPVTSVPLLDLKAQYGSIKPEVDKAVQEVVDSQYFIMGPAVKALEADVAQYCNCRHAVGVSSGTDALLISLMALGIGPGDEVITSPFTFFATVGSILRVGATVVFADIEPDTFNIDPAKVAKRVTRKTRAIMPVHLFGQCADMDPLLALASKKGIPIIEDAAQAIGSEYKGRRAGSMGTVGCFSFFPSKNLGAFGDAGMVTTNDSALAERLQVLRNQGAQPKYHHKLLGGNFRLDTLQAAVLRVKLKYLDDWSEKRRANATFYTTRLRASKTLRKRVLPPPVIRERHIFNQYVIRVKDRDALQAFLKEKGIGNEIYYPKAMHVQECLDKGQYRQGDFPLSEKASNEVLALPIYPELTEAQQAYVISAIESFYRG